MGLPPSAKTMAFIVTRDRARAVAFYTGVLGFRMTGEDDFAAVFDLNGTMMRLATMPGHVAAGHTVLGWNVADIEASVRGLRDAGVVFKTYDGFGQDALGIWRAPDGGSRVAWFLDPDGNVLSLAEF